MGQRIVIGAALLAFLALAVIADHAIGHPAFTLLVTVAMVLTACYELVRSSTGYRAPPEVYLAAAVTVLAPALAGFQASSPSRLAVTFCVAVVGTLVILFCETLRLQRRPAEDPGEHWRRSAAGVFSMAYVAVPMAFVTAAACAVGGGEGTLWAVVVVTIAKCGDIGGYLVGTLAGRHVMMPRVSPKKSWEGSLGGFALTVAAVFCVDALAPQILGDHPAWRLAAFGAVVNLATQAGDFTESMLKRSWQVKDSAALVPTFGGALDIIDSLVFAAPAAYLFLWFAESLP